MASGAQYPSLLNAEAFLTKGKEHISTRLNEPGGLLPAPDHPPAHQFLDQRLQFQHQAESPHLRFDYLE